MKLFFKTKIKVYVFLRGYFLKMRYLDNNNLVGLLIITGGGLLLSQEHIKERRKGRHWVRPWIRKTDSKEYNIQS